MNRNLKTFALVLITSLTIAAVLGSTAQALKGTLSASAAILTGEVVEHPGIGAVHTFTLSGGQVFTCEEIRFAATAKNGDEAITVIPSYNKCQARIGSEAFLMTVTMNDCDYLFYGGKKVSSTTFNEGQGDLVCPAGKVVEVHIYKSPTKETEELCTITIPPFVNNGGGELHIVAGSPNDITITSTTTKIAVKRDGSLLCGAANNTATYTGATTIRAFEDLGGTISNGTFTEITEGKQVSVTVSE